MKEVKIVFIPAWEEESIDYTKRIAKMTFGRSAKWKNIVAVEKAIDAKYAVCLGSYLSILKAKRLGFPRNRIIYIKRESIESLPEVDPSNYEIAYQRPGCLNGAIHWIDMGIEDLLTMSYDKNKRISSIVSSLKATKGHRQRLNFIEELAKLVVIDIYGKGHTSDAFSGQYKGPLVKENSCKSGGLINYEMSLAIENTSLHGYITEKLNDCFVTLCYPIYYGAPDAEVYFPKESFYRLNDLSDKSVKMAFEEASYKRVNSQTLAAIEYSRELVLTKYNIWNIISALVKKIDG